MWSGLFPTRRIEFYLTGWDCLARVVWLFRHPWQMSKVNFNLALPLAMYCMRVNETRFAPLLINSEMLQWRGKTDIGFRKKAKHPDKPWLTNDTHQPSGRNGSGVLFMTPTHQ
jgi:hypothetical protein